MCVICDKMNFLIAFASIFMLYQPFVNAGYTYQLGACANVEPMPGFNMDKFTGPWYAIQETSTASRCLLYNFSKTEYRNKFTLEELSENPVIAIAKNNTFDYDGEVSFTDENNQALMTIKFPFSVSWFGGAEYIVFMTDYENYAGVYSCQKLLLAHRESATILSRTRTLDKKFVDKVRNRLASFNVNPFDLSNIDQADCNLNTDFKIRIDDKTLSYENIKNAAINVKDKIETGVETAKKFYEGANSHDKNKQ